MQAALAASAIGSVAQGMSASGQAKAQQEQAQINAYIARTRALQTDTDAKKGLDSELGEFRSALGANQQAPGVGTLEILRELRDVRGRERRISVGNRMSEAADFRMTANAAGSRGRSAMLGGFINAGPSLFSLYEARTKTRA